ncbi:Protein charlatan [Armadillidium nasatum]|uniref:Protein charlatan n=1 Tax=Armadillidium nasatum TaxID=96803 RepID=A0A5N5T8B4_9CRUS|nr:Protein charlatan [Armadillidium nasatum]
MRSSEFLEGETMMAGTGVVGICNSFMPSTSSKLNSGSISPPVSFDVAAYTRILQQMTKLYPFDPAAVAASVSSLGHTSRLPLIGANGVSKPNHFVDQTSKIFDNLNVKENILVKDEANTSTIKDHDTKALDLSTQGLKSLYSHYRRIPLNQVKPKIVEDVWVENDYILKWSDSRVAAYNPAQKLFMCVDCECVGFLSRVAEHWLGAHANMRVFHCPRCPYTSAWSRCVKMHLTRQHNEQFADTTMWKENATLLEVTKLMQDLRTKVETKIDANNTLADKRFYCPHCPYATDRRDLYTRHENIHKDNKPFHCYLCFKQFNRADHNQSHPTTPKPDDFKPQSFNLEIPLKIQIPSNIRTGSPDKIPEVIVSDVNSEGSQISSTIHSRITKPVGQDLQNKTRRKGERAFSCHYCHWSGTDNWCLKRHMNTHIKPFACILCDYKAARAERLSTHVWKVHNKRICNKCNFLADTQDRLLEHTREEHHNNPYSRRHICASCGMSFDTRANLETHIHLAHARPKSPFDIVQITPITNINQVQISSEDIKLNGTLPGEKTLLLICPVEECSKPCETSGILAEHVRRDHGGLFASRCPHCTYRLTQDELSKDHWLTHHEDVCNACVHVFTSVYGPQLWKKVHVRPQSSSSPLNAIVNGLKRKSEPEVIISVSQDGLSNSSSYEQFYPLSSASENTDCDGERSSKRQRKQSCPKKVITILSENEDRTEQVTEEMSEVSSSAKVQPMKKKRKRIKCLRCPNRNAFSTFARLRAHRKLKHKKLLLKKRSLRLKKLRLSSCL